MHHGFSPRGDLCWNGFLLFLTFGYENCERPMVGSVHQENIDLIQEAIGISLGCVTHVSSQGPKA